MAAAFRLYSKIDTFWGTSGQLLPNGYLKFYTAATTTPKAVYGEKALTTNNGTTVTLDASGRPSVDVWGSGSYFVELYDVSNVKQAEADNVQVSGGEATALPTLSASKFLTNDGSVMSWATILQVPDPTGSSNKVLSTDGTVLSWIPKPADGATPVLPALPATGIANVSPTVTRIGTTIFQTGTGNLPATGTTKSTGNFTFGTAMSACSIVLIQMTSTVGTYMIATKVTGISGTGFTLEGDTNIFQVYFNSVQSFSYLAIGTV